jgi:hypothetical protein
MSAAKDATETFSSAQPRAEVKRPVMLTSWMFRWVGVHSFEVEKKVSISVEILFCKSKEQRRNGAFVSSGRTRD